MQGDQPINPSEILSCDKLTKINQLWLKYSEDRFGFSAQKRIFDECQKSKECFWEKVGWAVEGSWVPVYQPDLMFPGHFPVDCFLGAWSEGLNVIDRCLNL